MDIDYQNGTSKNESDNDGFDGVIIPKKTVNEMSKLLDEADKNVVVEISRTKGSIYY